MDNKSIKKLEADLWESADLLRAGSKLTSQQYCMPVLGLLFLRYAYSRFKKVEEEILKDRPVRKGRVLPVEASDFTEKSALYLPKEAQYSYLVNLPEDIVSANIVSESGQHMNSLGEVVNHAMELVEAQSEQLSGVLPKDYTIFSDDLLAELLRIFNNNALDEVGGDVIGRIYEYFLSKFAPVVASDDGVFFTPKSLVKMIVNILEPSSGNEAKAVVKEAAKKDKKKTQAEFDERIAEQEEQLTIAKEAVWLYSKFGEGEYQDIPGICKIADRSEIEDKGWSLTPGAYVGVAPVEDDGVDFHERMGEIHEELLKLQEESNRLMKAISQNMKEMGI